MSTRGRVIRTDAMSGCRYPTFCVLGGADPTNDVMFMGKVRPIDGVDVWPLLTGANRTQPRALTPTTEVSIIDVGIVTSDTPLPHL